MYDKITIKETSRVCILATLPMLGNRMDGSKASVYQAARIQPSDGNFRVLLIANAGPELCVASCERSTSYCRRLHGSPFGSGVQRYLQRCKERESSGCVP